MDPRSLAPRMPRHSRLTLIAGWLILVTAGFVLISYAGHQQVEQAAHASEQQLQLLAASEARGVSAWAAARRDALGALAENVSLKLYLSQLALTPSAPSADEPAELTFLRNLVFSAAASSGFGSMEETVIRANVPVTPGSGLRLTDAKGVQIVATRNMPVEGLLPPTLLAGDMGKPTIVGPFTLGSDTLALGFRRPIFSVQSDPGEGPPAGQLTAAAALDDAFFHLLEPPVPSLDGSQSLLVKSEGDRFVYILPASGAQTPLQVFPADRDLSTRQAIASPGSLAVERDRQDRIAFAVASPVDALPGWWLIRKVDRGVALADAVQRSRWWRFSYLLAAALLTAMAIAFWRNQSALRAKESARHYRALAHRIEQQEQMLTLIAETTPVSTYIVDRHDRFRYANRRAAEEFHTDRGGLDGKTLTAVLGASRAEEIAAVNRRALAQNGSQRSVDEDVVGGMAIRSLVREHIPLASIPVGAEDERMPGVLILETDVTSLTQSRERERRSLSELIRTLVSIVDKRDPHAAHHSACVSLVAHAVAETLRLADPLPETARIAGQFVNLGKILVPEALLTATDLQGADREKIREALHASADLLQGVPFEGPVTETIRQSQEAPDGSGPLGLKGDAILPTARIVAVANAFIAMISDRAWRQGKSMDEALKAMLDGIGTRYDRATVAALVTYVESGQGSESLKRCLEGMES